MRIKGPITESSIQTRTRVLELLEQATEDPFEYYLILSWERSGVHELYARINGTALPIFPLEVYVSSMVVDPEKSTILDLHTMAYQVCSIDLVFDIELLDIAGNPMSTSDYSLRAMLKQRKT